MSEENGIPTGLYDPVKEAYHKGWDEAFDLIADYVEEEVCIVTAEMIRRMKDEQWRKKKS